MYQSNIWPDSSMIVKADAKVGDIDNPIGIAESGFASDKSLKPLMNNNLINFHCDLLIRGMFLWIMPT